VPIYKKHLERCIEIWSSSSANTTHN